MIFDKVFLNKFFVCVFLIITIFSFNMVSVFAATPGNKDNYYDDIYSLNQYTTVSALLNDSGYAPDDNFVNNFLSSTEYKYKYIVSYCNSGNCEQTADSRSIGFVAFNDDVSAKFIQNGRNLEIKFSGSPDSMVYIYRKDNFLASSAKHSLSRLNYTTTFNRMRSFLPVSNVT